MRIALIAAYNNNYGSMLQCYATQQIIIKLGHDCEIIKYYKRDLWRQVLRIFNLPLLKMKMAEIMRNFITKLKYPKINNNLKLRFKMMDKFRKDNLLFTEEINSKQDLANILLKNYDIILLGSDQVWNPINMGTHFFTMELVPDKCKKVTYAPSFGVTKIPWYQIRRTKRYLKRINKISVREESGKNIIKHLIGSEVKVVCDPTILLDRESWDNLRGSEPIIKERYLLCYFLGDNPEQRQLVKRYAEKNNLKIVILPHLDKFIKNDVKFGDRQLYKVGPKEFINIVSYADCVMTDSLHGTIFSILYRKDFYVFPRFCEKEKSSTNSRIDNLLKKVNLRDRKFSGKERLKDLNKTKYPKDIDILLNEFRQESLNYLKNALSI